MCTIHQGLIRTALLALAVLVHSHSHAAPPADIEHGKALATTCLACHGTENFKSDPLYTTPRLGRQNARYLYNALKAYKMGDRANLIMQAQVAALSDQDLRDLAEYFGNKELDAASVAAVRALGEGGDTSGVPKKVVEVCGSCHGETGGGSMPETPSLAGQYADYMVYALDQYRSGKRNSAFMQPLAKQLSKAEIKEIADYYGAHASQPFSVKTSPLPILKKPDAVAITVAPEARNRAPRSSMQIIEGIEMIDIPGSSFMMGDAASEGFTVGSPKHEVKVKAFRIGKYEVTFDQYDAFARETKRALPDDEGWGRGNRPVINVTWADTQAFIAWLNKKSGRHFRLPSEAEWEYAARGGMATVYWWGDTFDPENINASGTNKRDQWLYTAPVGQFPANPYGLYDTSGNVAERVSDCWHHTYKGAPTDGSPWLGKACYTRISRGGSWNLSKRPMRSSARAGIADTMASTAVGFRLVEDKK